MKKIALCLALAAVYGSAQAASLSVVNLSPEFAVNCYEGCNAGSTHQPKNVTGDKNAGNYAALQTNGAGTFTATYLGQDSGYLDGFKFVTTGGLLDETKALGTTISQWVNSAGVVDFQFFDSKGASINNGDAPGKYLSFALLKNGPGSPFAESNAYGNFQYLLGFNDSAKSDADFNDYVVGVNFVSAVPLPAALPLMASAVGLIGVGMRRRKASIAPV